MTEKTEYKEIVFYFINQTLSFEYDEGLWTRTIARLKEDAIFIFDGHVFTSKNIQFVERR